MSEPKVVHEWDGEKYKWRLFSDGLLLALDGVVWLSHMKPVLKCLVLELTRLAARVEELEGAYEAYATELGGWIETCDLRDAEIKRLREALGNINNMAYHHELTLFEEVATAALKEKP